MKPVVKPLIVRYAQACIDRDAWRQEAALRGSSLIDLREQIEAYAERNKGYLRANNALRDERDEAKRRLDRAGEEYGNRLASVIRERDEALAQNTLWSDAYDCLVEERDEAQRNYDGACMTVAKMHEAAVGEVRGPTRGVVEDVADLRAERDDLRNRLDWIHGAAAPDTSTPSDWHALAAEELARAEVSTAGHGDEHDAPRATGWGPLL